MVLQETEPIPSLGGVDLRQQRPDGGAPARWLAARWPSGAPLRPLAVLPVPRVVELRPTSDGRVFGWLMNSWGESSLLVRVFLISMTLAVWVFTLAAPWVWGVEE